MNDQLCSCASSFCTNLALSDFFFELYHGLPLSLSLDVAESEAH